MNWLSRLESKIGKYAIKGLPKYIIGLYAIGFLLQMTDNARLASMLTLNPYMILHGQVWRLFTFLLFGPQSNLIFIIIALYFYYSICSSLEQVWGSFRFNMYYFIGVLGTILGAFLTYFFYVTAGGAAGMVYGAQVTMDTFYLNMSLFLAFAMMFPDMQVLLFLIVPVKVKWMGWLDALYLGYIFITSGFTVYGISIKVSIVVAFLNFLLFFFSMKGIKLRGEAFGKKVRAKRKKNSWNGQAAKVHHEKTHKGGARHECAVCHRTELDDPTLEFRYCSKCDGAYEYCQDHLFTHKHVKK